MNRKSLGKRIRTERQQLRLTQEQLAELIGVSSTYIGLVERGERAVTLEKLIRIANVLHVSVDYLLSDSAKSSADNNFILLKNLWLQASPAEQALILDLVKSVLHHSE